MESAGGFLFVDFLVVACVVVVSVVFVLVVFSLVGGLVVVVVFVYLVVEWPLFPSPYPSQTQIGSFSFFFLFFVWYQKVLRLLSVQTFVNRSFPQFLEDQH